VALLATLGLSTVGAPPAAATTTLGQRADAEARRHAGKPYEYGAAGPGSFDCSGFTMYVYARLGKRLPHNSARQYDAVQHVARSSKRLGDLIFTKRDGRIRHVGVYAGGSYIWSPVQTGDHVRKQSFAGRDYVVGRVR
jgi:cell wall-associated NlpC family hydrolase